MSTISIILIGVIYSMFVSSIWRSSSRCVRPGQADHLLDDGPLLGSTLQNALVLLAALVVFGGLILRYSRELNAFAVSEEMAKSSAYPCGG
jgi:ABC-type Fe3+-siderophore transport system permease subunit